MAWRLSPTALVAAALILTGITLPVIYARWLNTRTFTALELPVSLAPGRASSPDFSVNLEGWYWIGADVDQNFPFRPDCGFGGRPPLLKAHVTVFQDGHLLDQFDGADRFFGHLHAELGRRYRIDVDVLTNASCLNAGHPRILVWTDSSNYEYLRDLLWIASAVLVLWGIGAVFFSVARHSVYRLESQGERSVSGGTIRGRPSRREKPLKRRFAVLPSFGLLYATILTSILLPSFLIYLYVWGYERPSSVGVRVQLVKPGPLRSSEGRPAAPLLRVKCKDGPPRLYLNATPILPGTLPEALKRELKSREAWVVYVGGDSNCDWQDVADAIDVVRGMGAQAILSTADTQPSNAKHSK